MFCDPTFMNDPGARLRLCVFLYFLVVNVTLGSHPYEIPCQAELVLEVARLCVEIVCGGPLHPRCERHPDALQNWPWNLWGLVQKLFGRPFLMSYQGWMVSASPQRKSSQMFWRTGSNAVALFVLPWNQPCCQGQSGTIAPQFRPVIHVS